MYNFLSKSHSIDLNAIYGPELKYTYLLNIMQLTRSLLFDYIPTINFLRTKHSRVLRSRVRLIATLHAPVGMNLSNLSPNTATLHIPTYM